MPTLGGVGRDDRTKQGKQKSDIQPDVCKTSPDVRKNLDRTSTSSVRSDTVSLLHLFYLRYQRRLTSRISTVHIIQWCLLET